MPGCWISTTFRPDTQMDLPQANRLITLPRRRHEELWMRQMRSSGSVKAIFLDRVEALRQIRAVAREALTAFPAGQLIAPTPPLFDHAGQLFRILYGDGSGLSDPLGVINDLLIALTARHIGATVITNNLSEFHRIGKHLPGLAVVSPDTAGN